MKKALFLGLLILGLVNVAQAVAIDDSLTPQNCDRSNPACAQFVDTTSVGQVKWGGFIAGGLRSLTNLFVDGKLGVGTLRPSTGEQVLKLDVEGAVGAKFYCDENGNHCVAGGNLGGGNTTNINLTGNGGVLVYNPTSNTYILSISTSTIQSRITGTCPAGEAVRVVNQDGTVVCQSTSGTGNGDSFWTANGNNIFNNNSGNVGLGTNNPQQKLDINGNLFANGKFFIGTPEAGWKTSWIGIATNVTNDSKRWLHIGGEQDSNWNGQTSDGDRRIAFFADRNYFTGKIGVGVQGPSAMLDIKQTSVSDAFAGQPSLKFSNAENKVRGEFGRYSNGAELTSEYAGGVGVAATVTNGGRNVDHKNSPSTAIMGMATAPEAYTGRFIGYQGLYTRGDKFGLYATNELGGEEAPDAFLSDVRSGKSYAAYFADAVNSAKSFAAFFKGKIAIVDGTQGVGKILASDASGTASWKTPSELGLAGGTASTPANFTFSGPYNISSVNQGTQTKDLGVHKICMLTVSQYSITAGAWGNPVCKVGRNANNSWYFQAMSDSKGIGAHCEALCLD